MSAVKCQEGKDPENKVLTSMEIRSLPLFCVLFTKIERNYALSCDQNNRVWKCYDFFIYQDPKDEILLL